MRARFLSSTDNLIIANKRPPATAADTINVFSFFEKENKFKKLLIFLTFPFDSHYCYEFAFVLSLKPSMTASVKSLKSPRVFLQFPDRL